MLYALAVMFQNRRNSQKPPEELIANFKATFPSLSSAGRSASTSTTADSQPPTLQSSTSLNALDVAVSSRQHGDEHEMKDLDPTPRANTEQWRFTPSLLDPNSFAFSTFANQPPGYYTPTPGGTNTIYHPQAGDLHTPGYAMGVGTPLSMPTSESGVQIGQPPAPVHQFNPQAMAPHLFQNPNPFAYQQSIGHAQDHQQSFAPHQFSHQQPHFEQFQHHLEQPKMQEYPVDIEMQEHGAMEHFHQPVETMEMPVAHTALSLPPVEKYVLGGQASSKEATLAESWANLGSNFRYHSTLNAPTAMIKHADEIPVTYLNKGQSYTISIVDTKAVNLGGVVPTYRTFIRISFEDEQQRQRPAQCWQLWKEGRGTNEAHHRGGRLQAVEFVDPTQSSGLDPASRPRFEVESSSFDGFSVKWWPATHGSAECAIPVRFNFLSTDFSHSKGVKGIPVRLCAKTQLFSTDIPLEASATEPEICYCKVKLFRDHGAERKLSNDVAHVKKSIDKLKQQIAQAESGMKDFKRKRSESGGKPGSASKPGKVPKHKRTWSLSSTSDGGNKITADEDLHSKLAVLQDMFTSTRPASVLFLKGDEADDPDLHPVQITGELQRVDTGDSTGWEKQSTNASSIVSPSPSQNSQERPESSTLQRATSYQSQSRMGSSEWQSAPQTATGDLHPGQMNPPDVPIKIQKSASGPLPEWIEAIGVDYSYQPPPERIVKPVACFYIKPQVAGQPPKDDYYRAVYLMQRTLPDLINGIALKSDVESHNVLRSIRINKTGLAILVDDEMVHEIPEGQDMIAEFQEIKSQVPMKREWDSGPSDIQVDGEIDVVRTSQLEGYELRLHF